MRVRRLVDRCCNRSRYDNEDTMNTLARTRRGAGYLATVRGDLLAVASYRLFRARPRVAVDQGHDPSPRGAVCWRVADR
jgi:hypothetical protein